MSIGWKAEVCTPLHVLLFCQGIIYSSSYMVSWLRTSSLQVKAQSCQQAVIAGEDNSVHTVTSTAAGLCCKNNCICCHIPTSRLQVSELHQHVTHIRRVVACDIEQG